MRSFGYIVPVDTRSAQRSRAAPGPGVADQVEILYDLDIEAKAWAKELGVVTYRSASLNAGAAFVQALAAIARRGG